MQIKYIILCLLCVSLAFQNSKAQLKSKTKTLLNGVEVKDIWPPETNKETERKEMPVPYLQKRQKVIPVNVGRQLFVDSFLIDATNLDVIYHKPIYSQHPVLEPDKEWEMTAGGPYASPFSDGIWYDENENKYKMWYLAGRPAKIRTFYTCYAESDDGIVWNKPNLKLFGNTNIVDTFRRDASTIWLDKEEKDVNKRFKMFTIEKRDYDDFYQVILKYSANGIQWSRGVAQSGDMYDRTTAFYNPFSKKWVLSMRYNAPIGRARSYLENKNPETLLSLAHRIRTTAADQNIIYWFGADNKEPRNPHFPEIDPQIYNHDAIAYESLMLNYFSIWEGPENDVAGKLGIQKRNEVLIGFSRDGFHITRPSHEPFMGVNESDTNNWNYGNIQSIAGVPIIKGDSLYFYVSGRRLNKEGWWDAYTSTGLATMRRDGFASINSTTDGYLTTRNIIFDGDYFFVNANVKEELRVELQDINGKPIHGFTKEDCIPMKTNSTKYLITWKNKKNVMELKNKPVKVKFYLKNGDLYSFWVSKWKTGESRGYTAGGGPGLNAAGIDMK